MPCEICNGECHLGCLIDSESSMICKACNASKEQIVIDVDNEDESNGKCHPRIQKVSPEGV